MVTEKDIIYTDKYCPLIVQSCRKDCVFFIKNSITDCSCQVLGMIIDFNNNLIQIEEAITEQIIKTKR